MLLHFIRIVNAQSSLLFKRHRTRFKRFCGKTKIGNPQQFKNACCFIIVILSEKVSCANLVHPKKLPVPTEVILSGITNCVIGISRNFPAPIAVAPYGIVTVVEVPLINAAKSSSLIPVLISLIAAAISLGL